MEKSIKIVLKIKNLVMKFGELYAINNFNMNLIRGEMIGLIGPNGAGKTTIFNCITGIYTPFKGSILLDDEEITGKQPWKIRRKGITRTFQTSRIIPNLSVYDNAFIGSLADKHNSILNAVIYRGKFIREVQKEIDKVNKYFNIFNKELINKGFMPASELSQIDTRRLEVVRALMMNSKVLLLDEPTAGMTMEESKEFIEDIYKIKENFPELGVVIIEHDMEVIKGATNRVIVLNYGELLVVGSFNEIAENLRVREAYLGE
jgi:branched-chain amino acid transport system ATP-binding protein